MKHNPKIEQVLADPAVSFWLKDALRAAAKRDPVDAYNDAKLLVELLAPAPEAARLEAERHAVVLGSAGVGEWLNQQFYRSKGERIL